jgi:hypothetical protein
MRALDRLIYRKRQTEIVGRDDELSIHASLKLGSSVLAGNLPSRAALVEPDLPNAETRKAERKSKMKPAVYCDLKA